MVSPTLGMGESHIEMVRQVLMPYSAEMLSAFEHRWAWAQWVLLVAALILLAVDSTEYRSPMLVGLLVPLIFINAPDLVFDFFRHEPGHWISAILVLAVLYTPPIYIPPPTNLWASIILLIVVAPTWLVRTLRFSPWGILISFLIAIFLLFQHFQHSSTEPEGYQGALTKQHRLPTTLPLLVCVIIPIYFFIVWLF
jgi:lysylphosphatidylglycerol synthetase-like protein (DUF2156 family)